MAEIKKETYFITCGTQIIIYLTTVCIVQLSHCLEFNNNIVVTDKICTIGLFQLYSIIIDLKFLLSFKGNLLPLELYFKSLLINSF